MKKNFEHKKSLGQHFLKDDGIALDIVEALKSPVQQVIEVGPGLGILTKFLYKKYHPNLTAVDVDDRLAEIIPQKFEGIKFIHQDILKVDFEKYYPNEKVSVIGNFPYNISTEIVFRVIEQRHQVVEMVGMFQKEVALRLASKHGNKVFGVTSIFSQAYFKVEYLFDVPPHFFDPPPKVNSGVVRFTRLENQIEILDEKSFFRAVKAGFSQRRKTLRNSLKAFTNTDDINSATLDKRAEQLSVEEWINLANEIFNQKKLIV
ncbi:MAG: dimethyladenosine transferase [Bacteroidota bacterium]